MNNKKRMQKIPLLIIAFSILLLTGCAKLSDAISTLQGDGETNEEVNLKFDNVDTLSDAALKSMQAFKINLYPKLVQKCGDCHTDRYSPKFAQNNAIAAYQITLSEPLVNLDSPADSRFITRLSPAHNCVPECGAVAASFQKAIEAWVAVIGDDFDPSIDGIGAGMGRIGERDNTPTETIIALTDAVENVNAFGAYLHPTLVQQCGNSGCHGNDVSPKFATSDIATAYSFVSANSLVNLSNAASSRLVKKPLTIHECIGDTCQTWSNNILAGIELWADEVAGTIGGAGISGAMIISKPLTLSEGVKDEGQGRVSDAIIAKYEFTTGEGTTAFDTSGVSPTLDLGFAGDVVWLPGRGVEITDPNNQEDTRLLSSGSAAKNKLYKKIAGPEGSKQYTIEAWIINDNTALDGPARIVSYSLDGNNTNFTMGQDTDYYSFRNRSDKTGNNGNSPVLETDNNAGDLKTQLQHIVFTFDPENGRNIYVNGIKTAYEGVRTDPAVPTQIGTWDSSDAFQLVLGNEVRVHRQWLGKILFVAIHERALTEDEIIQNTLEGIGDRFILEFDVSALLDPDGNTTSTIKMVVSELDEFSYVFGEPSLITNIASPNIPVKNMRIAVNGSIPAAAQSFRNVNLSAISSMTQLSRLGAVIPKDVGPEVDRFSIVFEVLGNNSNVVVTPDPVPVVDMSVDDPVPENGLRTFARINNTMAVLTGVDPSSAQESYLLLEQQLPSTPGLDSFVTSHQVGIAKLSLDYCDVMVEDTTLRTVLYGGVFEFASPVATAFSSQAKRDIIISNTVNKFVGTNLTNQPTLAEIQPDLDQLISELSASCAVDADCDSARTKTIVKAVCAAVLASAAVSID